MMRDLNTRGRGSSADAPATPSAPPLVPPPPPTSLLAHLARALGTVAW